MTKKLIPISIILALAVTFGLAGSTNAAYNSVTFSVATTINIEDLVISSDSMVESITVGTTTVTMTLASGSEITFTSANGKRMVLDHTALATDTCTSSNTSSIIIPFNASFPTVILSVTGETCAGTAAPIISTMVVTNTTAVTIVFSRSIAYVSDSVGLIAATTFAGVTPASTSISDTDLVLTFASGALAAAAVKDDSKLILPTSQIRSSVDATKVFAGTTTQVVTDLATINQLYDFVFVIQLGQNFISVPYDVVGPDGTAVNTTAKVAATYVVPSGKTISTQTIGNAGGNFANASSFSVLYGYYINSNATGNVYLRLNKASSQSLTFERTFTAIGWHMIGVATDNAVDSIGNNTDDDILSSLTIPDGSVLYDRVLDIAVGQSSDRNTTATPDETYDTDVYKALLSDDYSRAQTAAQINAVDPSGIEFNHGEAYFILITGLNAKYVGEKVADGNLTK